MLSPASGMNYAQYRRAFMRAARRWEDRYTVTTIGRARFHPRPVPLLRLSNARPRAGGVMLLAGFHGEEPAGPLALLHHLHHLLGRALDLRVPLCIYPVVNPHGFDNHVRTTVDGSFTNAGFIHDEDPTGPEVALLRADMARFRPAVFVDLHEDDRESRTYLYSFGDETLARQLADILGSFIPAVDGPLSHDGGLVAARGLIRELHDGSAEDFMAHQGIHASFATETPTRVPLKLRIAAKLAVMDHCLEHAAQVGRPSRRGGP